MRDRDFKALTGWLDIDRPKLGGLTKAQQIRYFRSRISKVVVEPLRGMYAGVRRARPASNPLLCFGTCLCCGIEALGKFHTGCLARGNSGTNFKAFVRDYMDPGWFSNSFASKRYVDHLWDSFRNGLAHGFAIKHGGFTHQRPYFQVSVVGGSRQLQVDPGKLLHDFRGGLGRFVGKVRAVGPSDPVYLRFKAAFEGVFVKGL